MRRVRALDQRQGDELAAGVLQQVEGDVVRGPLPGLTWQPTAGGDPALQGGEAGPAAVGVPDDEIPVEDAAGWQCAEEPADVCRQRGMSKPLEYG